MQTKWIAVGVTAGLALFSHGAPAPGEEAAFRAGIGLGVLESPGFKSYMDDMYFDRDQSGTLVILSVDGKLRVRPDWDVVPALEFFISPNGIWDTVGFVAASLNARYALDLEPGLFLQVGPNFTFNMSDMEADGGVGGAASIVYAFNRPGRSRFSPEIQMGYSYLYASADPGGNPYYDSHRTDVPSSANFGGPFLRLALRF